MQSRSILNSEHSRFLIISESPSNKHNRTSNWKIVGRTIREICPSHHTIKTTELVIGGFMVQLLIRSFRIFRLKRNIFSSITIAPELDILQSGLNW